MRASFREQLDALRGSLIVMGADVTSAMRWATASLLEGDLSAASKSLEVGATIRQNREEIDESVVELLVRQQPVASDLRLALASLQVAADFERMGALAEHVAKIVLMRHPVTAVPPEVAQIAQRMAEIAERLAGRCTACWRPATRRWPPNSTATTTRWTTCTARCSRCSSGTGRTT